MLRARTRAIACARTCVRMYACARGAGVEGMEGMEPHAQPRFPASIPPPRGMEGVELFGL